ncbi:MAG: hypothetical protein IJV24_01080 [Prevotella sp.]|nr:hypothetical protein [Prevotella sp.]
MMRHIKLYLPLLLAAALLAACSEYESSVPAQDDMATLRINVLAPGQTGTRAEGQEQADDAERYIHNVSIWAFSHSDNATDDSRALGYAFKDDIPAGTLSYQWLEMGLPKSAINQPLDFYVVANTKGTGFESMAALGYYPTRKQVESASFTAFGTDANAVRGAVPGGGLPASRIVKGLRPVTSLKGDNRLSITLLRAVGKFRFFFARPDGIDCEVTRIELSANVLPSSSLMMPAASTSDADLPHPTSVTLPESATMTSALLQYNTTAALTTSNIKEVEDPTTFLRGSGETFSDYIARLSNATDGVTEYADGLTYIRESNVPLRGKIYYKIGEGEEKSIDFEMQTSDSTVHARPCFPRNHYSVVYAYFKGGRLYVQPQVQPWTAGTIHEVYTATTTLLTLDKIHHRDLYDYIVWSEDRETYDDMTWYNDYCAVSYGLEASTGRPLYAPFIELTTTSNNQLTLMTDNGEFGFIPVTKPAEQAPQMSFGTFTESIVINPGRDVSTCFYIVPKRQFDQASGMSRFCNVTLLEHPGEGYALQRLPWNHTLPGLASGESARIYYVSPTDYLSAVNNARNKPTEQRQIFHLESGGYLFYYGEGNE